MTLKELNDQIGSRLGFCDCGEPEQALKLVKLVLTTIDYSHELGGKWRVKWLCILLPTTALRMTMLYLLSSAGYVEHGSSIEGSWLTDEGRAFLGALREYGVYLDDEEYEGYPFSDN